MYVVRQTCTKCGRATKYPSTAVTRPCPFCNPNATHSTEKAIPRSKEAPKVNRGDHAHFASVPKEVR